MGIVFRSRKKAKQGIYDTENWASSSIEVLRVLEDAGAKFKITGFDNLRKAKQPVVFVCNHMSTLETMVLPGLIAPIMEHVFVVKDSLVSNPVFGPVIGARSPIEVSRKNSRDDLMKVLNEGSEKLGKGLSIVIFPQSTRRDVFRSEEFNTLGEKLASRNKVELIPIALKTDFWKNGKLVKDLGPLNRKATVMFRFGEPLSISGSGKEEHSKIIGFISASLNEWGGLIG